jgi:proteasome accessory factor B
MGGATIPEWIIRGSSRTLASVSTRRAKPAKGKPSSRGAEDEDKKPAKGAPRDDRSKRLLDLVVMLLGARQPVPYREIKAQFRAYRTENEEAGLRAFERDKADLLELGVPLRYVTPDDDDAVDEAGYVVDLRRYRLPEVHLTPEEVAALVLAGSVARAAPGTTYAEVVDLALKKLAFDAPPAPDTPGAPPGQKPHEPVLVHFPRTTDAEVISERLAEIEHAIRNRKRITVDYTTSSTGEVNRREIDPYGLVFRQRAWLLVGFDHLRQSVRSFRLDRFGPMTVAPKPKSPDFERPAGFDVRSYASRSPWTFEVVDAAMDVTLDILPAAAAVAEEEFGPGAVKTPHTEAGAGAVRVRFSCRNPDFVVGKVLEHKGALVVREPAELRARVRAEVDAVRKAYA